MISLLPIVQREVRLASRRNGTYWTRCGTAALVGGVLFSLAQSTKEPGFLVAPMIFWVLKALTFGYCLFAGVRYTADALSEERREGTLGLLFLTDLHGYDVVLGKMVIRSLNAFLGLLAVIPLLAVPVMMGGVSAGEFWRDTLVMMNTLFFSLAIGLIISAYGLQERNVMLATLATLLCITFGLPLCWESMKSGVNLPWVERLLLLPSPAYALQISASGLFVPVRSQFWDSMLTIATVSVVCVAAAGLRLSRSIQLPAFASAPGSSRRKSRPGRPELPLWREDLNAGKPYLWRVRRDRSMMHWNLFLAVVLGLFGLYSLITLPAAGTRGMRPGVVFGWLAVHWMLKVLFTSEACRALSEDKQAGALELLLCTPLQPRAMLQAQGEHLRRLFVLPILVVCIANLLISAADGDRVLTTGFFWGLLLLPVDCWALRWTSIYASLESNSFTVAVFSSIWRVMMPSWLALFCVVLLLMATEAPEGAARFFFSVWAVGTLVYDAWVASWKRVVLRAGFRRLAAGERRFATIGPA